MRREKTREKIWALCLNIVRFFGTQFSMHEEVHISVGDIWWGGCRKEKLDRFIIGVEIEKS